MATQNREAINTFTSITGVPEALAIQKLEEHGGNLNEAVNAYFNEGDGNIRQQTSISAPQDDVMDIDDPVPNESQRPPFPLLTSARNFNPFSLLEPNFSGNIFDSGTNFPSRTPFVSHPREVREIPIEVKDGNDQSAPSGLGLIIEDVTETADVHSPETHETVIIDDENDKEIPNAHVADHNASQGAHPEPSAPGIDVLPDYTNDIEEEMLQAAIEASKKDTEIGSSNQHGHITAEQEKTFHELGEGSGAVDTEGYKPAGMEEPRKLLSSNGRQSRLGAGSSSILDEGEDGEERPLIRHRSRQTSSCSLDSTKEIGETEVISPSIPQQINSTSHPQNNGSEFHSDEWGGISSEEHDEAVMLEAALFGGIPEESGYNFPYAPHQFIQNGLDRTVGPYSRRIPRPPSPSVAAQRIIREQQDDEYLASLQADREKELKAKEEAEVRQLEELAAREAALQEKSLKEEESRRKLDEEQEIERQLAAKEASLPQEPSTDDNNGLTLLVRMPDGSRRGRRFLKSDKLQYLFDFIDIGRGVKPGTYRLVRPYPRRAFSDGESASTLDGLGLTSKQEALFLELI